jgi:Protein of unknown function (DUF2867)
MRLPDTAHTSRPWRIHELTLDFRVEDVWALPTPGGEHDFARLVQLTSTLGAAHGSAAVRRLFALRWKLGALLGLDRPQAGLGSRVPSLRDRLPDDLRDGGGDAGPGGRRFRSLYRTDDEWALEIANQTMHGVLHLGWVADEERGGHRGQMAVLVKRNGPLGAAYMAAIAPFRHLIVYPLMLRDLEREWKAAPETVRQIAVPPAARALSTLSRVDYADAFMLGGRPPRHRSPEQWARTILEDAPAGTRSRLLAGWSALGLKLGSSRSDRFVLGWEIRDSTPDFVLLSAGSSIGMPAQLLFKREPDGLLLATFVQHDNPAARAMWAGTESVHVAVVRRLLQAGECRLG